VPKIYAELQKINIGVIYLDESSRIKNPETKRTKNIMAFRHSFPKARRFCLSGTPSTKTPLGYYSQLEFLNYGYSDSESYFMFQRKYCTTGLFAKARLPNGREIFFRNDSLDDQLTWLQENYLPNSNQSYHQAGYFFTQKRSHVNPLAIPILHCFNRIFGYKNLDQLHQIHQTHAYTLKKQDVLKELPSKTYTIRKLEMTDEQRKAIDAIRKKHKLDVNGLTFNFADRNSPFATLHTIANGFIYGDDKKPIWFKEQPKLDEISNFIEELGDKKLIIWSAYPAQIEQIHTYLKEKMDRKSVMLYGGTRPEDRPGVLHEFQQDTDYLVANPEVGGLGLNLTVAYTELFASTWCKPDTRIQAEDRCHRIGQLNNVLIADIVVKGTVEIGILRNSKKEIDIENQIIKIKDLTDTLADHLGA
jgi:SNF2 family DNA or RNA helicase